MFVAAVASIPPASVNHNVDAWLLSPLAVNRIDGPACPVLR